MRYPWQKLYSVEALAACSLTVFLCSGGGVALAAGGGAAAVDSTRLDHADQDAGNWLTYVLDQSTATAIRAYVIHEANQSRQAPATSQNTAQ